MYTKFVLVIMLAILAGCKKDDNNVDKEKTATELLTQKEWIIAGAGFDDNNNGVLDPVENTLQDCQKDNSYKFNANGTGMALDNAVNCGVPINNNFNWRFINNETGLEISAQPSFILKLNETELIFNPDLPGLTVKLILMYRH
jgi:hypothetical protein